MLGNTGYKNSNEILLISKVLQQAGWRVKCDTIIVECDKCYENYKPDPNTTYKLFIQAFLIYTQYNCSIDLSIHIIVVITI